MKKGIALLVALMVVVTSVDLFARGASNGKSGMSGKSGSMNSYAGSSTQNGNKTGDRALDGSGKGYGDGTQPQPKDGTGFGALNKK